MDTDGDRIRYAKRAVLSLMVLTGLASAACDGEPRTEATPRAPVTATSSPSPSGQTPKGDRVVLESGGRTRQILATSVEDLKAVGLWKQLTQHLYEIKLDSRAGGANVPEDGHLADAYFTGVVNRRGAGPVCDVMFFPSAVVADLERWRRYYAAGLLAEPAPSKREFYGSLLAHELAHCRPGPRGEAVARSWETRALRLLRSSQI